MEAEEEDRFVRYLQNEMDATKQSGHFLKRMSGCVSSCLQVGMVTPRDLLQRIEEVDPGRINETRKAMRLYAHFKHGMTSRVLESEELSACFTREITETEARSLAESCVDFVADDPLCLRKTPGLADSTKETYRSDAVAIIRWASCRSGVSASEENEASVPRTKRCGAVLGHLSLFLQLRHQDFDFLRRKPVFGSAAAATHNTMSWPAGAAGLAGFPSFSSVQPASDPMTLMGAFNGGFSGAAGFAAMSSGSSYYYSNEIGWQRGHGGGGAVAGGDDVMMMLVDDTEGSDNSRPVTTGPPDWGQAPDEKYPASLQYYMQQPAPSAPLAVAHGGASTLAKIAMGAAGVYALGAGAMATGRYGRDKIIRRLERVRAEQAGGPILWEQGPAALMGYLRVRPGDVINVAACTKTKRSWPVVVSCSMFSGDAAQPGIITVNGLDPRALRRTDEAYDLAMSAMVAWSWVQSHVTVLVRFLGTPHAFRTPLQYARVWLTIHPDVIRRRGPSGAAAMAVAIVAKMWARSVRMDRAITGDMDLQGRILPVGGVELKARAFEEDDPGFQLLCPRENSPQPQPAAGGAVALTPVDTIWHALEQLLAGNRPVITPEAAMAMVVRDDVDRRGCAEAAMVRYGLMGLLIDRQLVQAAVTVYPGFGRVLVSGGDAVVVEGQARTAFIALADSGADILEQALGQDDNAYMLMTEADGYGTLKAVVDVHFNLPSLDFTTGPEIHWVGPTMAVALGAALARREVRADSMVLACPTGHSSIGQLGKQPLTVRDVEVLLSAGFRRVIMPVLPQPNHPSLQKAAARGLEVVHGPRLADIIRLSLRPAAAPPQPPPPVPQQPPPPVPQQPPPPPAQSRSTSLRPRRNPPQQPPQPGRGAAAPRGRGRRGRKG